MPSWYVAAAWLGERHAQRLSVWDLGPSPHGLALSDSCFGDLDRAVLRVTLDATGRVTDALTLRGERESERRAGTTAAWHTATAKSRLGMALDLVATQRLLGSTLQEVEALLGPSDDRRRRLIWRRDGWGHSTTIRLPLDADDRIDQRLRRPW